MKTHRPAGRNVEGYSIGFEVGGFRASGSESVADPSSTSICELLASWILRLKAGGEASDLALESFS